MDEPNVQQSSEPQSPADVHTQLPKKSLFFVAGLIGLALIGGIAYYNFLTKPADQLPSLATNEANPSSAPTVTNAFIPTTSPYDINEFITYTKPPAWEVQKISTEPRIGVVVGYGVNILIPKLALGTGTYIQIVREPQSMWQLNSMQQIKDKLTKTYNTPGGLKQTTSINESTFDGRQAIHAISFNEKYYEEKYVFPEDNTFAYIWDITIGYLAQDQATRQQLQDKYQSEVNQFIQSIHFK